MPEKVTTLTISSAGKYTYNPTSITVTEPNTTITYALDAKTAQDWEIVGQTNTDSKHQLSGESKSITGESISLNDANTLAETFDITIVAQHRSQRDRMLRIDPQVVNNPD